MKHWKTTDVGPTAVTKDTHRAVKGAANQFLREKNGGLPLNLAKHSRLSLLKLIKELNHELSVANNWVQHHQNHCDDLIKENAALREQVAIRDAEIDMWASRCAAAIYMLPEAVTGGQLKEAQDKFYRMLEKARKEAQP